MVDAPDFPQGLDVYAECFGDLSGDRQLADRQAGPIPYLAIMQWCRDHGLGAGHAQHVRRVVQALDAGMRKIWREEAEARAEKEKHNGPPLESRKYGRPG